jgi:hypothetical protein
VVPENRIEKALAGSGLKKISKVRPEPTRNGVQM